MKRFILFSQWDIIGTPAIKSVSASVVDFYISNFKKRKKRAPQDWMLVYVLHLAPQVGAKRTNRPGISTTDRGFPRARFRSRGGSFSSRARYYSGYTPPRGRGRAFRWADAETPHFRHRGRTLHLHALHLTHCLHWEERKGQTKHTAMTRISSRS